MSSSEHQIIRVESQRVPNAVQIVKPFKANCDSGQCKKKRFCDTTSGSYSLWSVNTSPKSSVVTQESHLVSVLKFRFILNDQLFVPLVTD